MKTVPHYRIDLELPEEDRWRHVIQKEKAAAGAVLREALDVVRDYIPTRALQKLAATAFETLYRASGGLYMDEMQAWARALRIPLGEMVMVQCSYELSHADLRKLLPKFPNLRDMFRFPRLGCTIGIHDVPGHGLTHFRSLDWPLETAGAATRLFTFEQDGREFITAGIAGYTGVLSGMLPGAYSVSMNWAPCEANPRFEFGPAFLLRHVLETCDTYAEARRALRDTELSANVFFALCGAKAGEACVIERTTTEAAVRNYRGKPLVQGNHFVSPKFAHLNPCDTEMECSQDEDDEDDEDVEDDDGSLIEDSEGRASVLCHLLSANRAKYSRRTMGPIIRSHPVCNDLTVHSVIFCPAQGTTDIWPGN